MPDHDIERWLNEYPEDSMLGEIASLELRIAELTARVEALRSIDHGRRLMRGEPSTPPQTHPVADPDTSSRDWPNRVVRRQAIVRRNRAAHGQPAAPGTSHAVLTVMHADTERDWRVAEIFDELELRGWLPDATDARRALDATLHRLMVTGQIRRVGRGTYQLPQTQPVSRRGARRPPARAGRGEERPPDDSGEHPMKEE
jgi:hypothetical protein